MGHRSSKSYEPTTTPQPQKSGNRVWSNTLKPLLTVFTNGHFFSGRKSEPTGVKYLRKLLLVFIYGVVLSYLVWLSKDYLDFERTMASNYEVVDEIAVPDVLLRAPYDLEIVSYNYSAGKKLSFFDVEKVEAVPYYKLYPGQSVWRIKTNGSFREAKYSNLIVEVNPADASKPRAFSPVIELFHPESSPFNPSFTKDVADPAKRAKELPVVENLQPLNSYSIPSGEQINIKLVESKRIFFVRTWVTKLFGYRNEKYTLNYFTSTLGSSLSASAKFEAKVNVKSYVMPEEQQHPSSSVFNVFNSIGGLIGVIFPIYAILFGDRLIGPWGCLHTTCCKRRQKRALEQYYQRNGYDWGTQHQTPFSEYEEQNGGTIDEEHDKKSDVTSKQPPDITIPMLVQRVQYLELFMQDYVVDTELAKCLFDTKKRNDRPTN